MQFALELIQFAQIKLDLDLVLMQISYTRDFCRNSGEIIQNATQILASVFFIKPLNFYTMDKETMNKYQMARSTQKYLDTNNATWSAVPIANTLTRNMH